MAKPVHAYTQLDSPSNQIRLLELTASTTSVACTSDQFIHCRLTVHSLDFRPTYTALSYTWGIDATRYSLIIDGATLLITANLHVALQRIAEDNRVVDIVRLWIDGICINQNDDEEKSSQVQMMQSIYM